MDHPVDTLGTLLSSERLVPALPVVASAALRQLTAAHLLHVEERPHAGQRLALGTVGARADVGQAPTEMKCYSL